MAYIGFDLDETLGYFGTVDILTKFLDPYNLVQSPPSPALDAKLKVAFDAFARCLVAQPNTANVLRPGLLQLFQRLAQLKAEGRIRAMAIYSNNGNPSVLRLAQRMLELGLGQEDLFCARVHAEHPVREEYNKPRFPPNAAPKTIYTLKGIFQQCEGGAASAPIENNRLFFFDDSVHTNIRDSIGTNYKVVAPFKIEQPVDVLESCFREAMESSGLSTDDEYFAYIAGHPAIAAGLAVGPTPFKALQQLAKGFLTPPRYGYVTWADDGPSLAQFIEEKVATVAGGRRRQRRPRKTRRLIKKRRTTRRRS